MITWKKMVEAAKREDATLPSLVIAYFQQDIEAITEDLKFNTVEEIDCISCKVRYELYNVPCEEHGGGAVCLTLRGSCDD